MTLINYIYELVSGLRGNSSEREAKYFFSRKGALELSQVEKVMALHELFGTASRWALDDPEKATIPEQMTVKLVLCLCLMIQRLMSNGVIKQNTDDFFEDYSHDLQVLLFPWIGKIPEARELFFKIKSDSYRRLEIEDAQMDQRAAEEVEIAENSNHVDIVSVLTKLEHLSYSQHLDAIQEPSVQLAFRDFSQRLFYHICRIYKVGNVDLKPFETSTSAQEDFYIFLTKFNEFSRNRTFVRNIFSLLQGVSVGERPEQLEDDGNECNENLERKDIGFNPDAEPIESEFNDAFLNGEGHFQDGGEHKADDKKKKKKKKKRRGKR
ncbi:hypothetical protein OXX80_011678 [Metschnikowia pulcherrima]